MQAEARSVPDAAPINAWAANATNNMIKEVLPANAIFDMALTNAVYLKGECHGMAVSCAVLTAPRALKGPPYP